MVSYSEVDLSTITVPARHRETDPLKVRALAESISEIGLQHPIGLAQNLKLIHGRHRLEACRMLEWSKIPALIHELDDLRAELAEIDENVERNGLNALQEAQAFKRRKEIYEALHPGTKRGVAGGKARQGSATDKMSFAEATAKKAGRSARSVRRAVALAERIPEDVQKAIADTPIADKRSELIKLSKLPEDEQRTVAQKLAAGEAKTIAQARGEKPQNREGRVEAQRTDSKIEPPAPDRNGDSANRHEPLRGLGQVDPDSENFWSDLEAAIRQWASAHTHGLAKAATE
ncbi:MAG TPA: ParB N-terminal domain-containing protein, partial [Phycisphaerae bacterium]|nr:ParB N-terminal domain-containing protein [Phycisphaerae bacterium]